MTTSLTSTRVALSTMAAAGKGHVSKKIIRTDHVEDKVASDNLWDSDLKTEFNKDEYFFKPGNLTLRYAFITR
jgi:hypothetical protein